MESHCSYCGLCFQFDPVISSTQQGTLCCPLNSAGLLSFTSRTETRQHPPNSLSLHTFQLGTDCLGSHKVSYLFSHNEAVLRTGGDRQGADSCHCCWAPGGRGVWPCAEVPDSSYLKTPLLPNRSLWVPPYWPHFLRLFLTSSHRQLLERNFKGNSGRHTCPGHKCGVSLPHSFPHR